MRYSIPISAAAFTASSPLFQRTPKEQEVFARMTFGIVPSTATGGVAPLLRPAAVAFGRRPLGACAQLVSATSMP